VVLHGAKGLKYAATATPALLLDPACSTLQGRQPAGRAETVTRCTACHTSCSTALAAAPQSTARTAQPLSRAVTGLLPVRPANLLTAVFARECFLHWEGPRLLHDLVYLAMLSGHEHSVCACMRYYRGCRHSVRRQGAQIKAHELEHPHPTLQANQRLLHVPMNERCNAHVSHLPTGRHMLLRTSCLQHSYSGPGSMP